MRETTVSAPERARGFHSEVARKRRWQRVPLLPILLLAPLVVFGIFHSFLAPYSPEDIDFDNALQPPVLFGGSWEHPLGTDPFGRDVLSRVIIGARTSLIVAFVGVALAGTIGVLVGTIAGYRRGWLDEGLMRVVDMQLAVPPILLAILIAGVLEGGMPTVIATVAVAFWLTYARVIRGETMSLMQRDFVQLAVVAGCGRARIIRRHLLPNLLGTIVVLATLQLGAAVGLEAALTFLGLGIQPPSAAWGLMISEGRGYMDTAWWVPTFPGIAIVMTVLGANLLGDWLRDRVDPALSSA